MTERMKKAKRQKIHSLVLHLNSLGLQKQQTLDELWELEKEAQEVRTELIALMDHGLEDI